MPSFKIAINMSGAISAGAYTAGVLDFLTEALDAWYQARQRGDLVPTHDVSIEAFSGASAGGMCAAISAMMLYRDFEHVDDVTRTGTSNPLYESWVNKIDIGELLQCRDLQSGGPVISLLDSTIIPEIADYALSSTGSAPLIRPYVSPRLTLFLSLTNLRGIPYSLNGAAPGSIEEGTLFYGDRIHFQVFTGNVPSDIFASIHPLDITQPGAQGGWEVLRTAAMATGAFPIFLAPRVLERNVAEYVPPIWEGFVSSVSGTPPPIQPNLPPGVSSTFATLNVDGGVTNNDPFNYAHDYLLALEPAIPAGTLHDPIRADRAVISIAPFPTTGKFNKDFNPARESRILPALSRLAGALISQSRFFGESLDQIMTGTTFGRFVVAPSDDELVKQYQDQPAEKQPPALQCATLGAFGGFFARGFRAHDYALGRRNCQKFLKDYFVLPEGNQVIGAALEQLDPATRSAVVARFSRPAPGIYAESAGELRAEGRGLPPAQAQAGSKWIPIIPLCTKAVTKPIERVPRFQITREAVEEIVAQIGVRFRNVSQRMISTIPAWGLRLFLRPGPCVIGWLAKGPLQKTLARQFGDSYKE